MSKYRAFRKLRRVVDGNDPFMTGGHQILKVRKIERETPEWAKSDEEIKKLLLRSFPKLAVHKRQREQAAKWMQIIHLYFRMHMTQGQVMDETGFTLHAVKSMIRNIKRVVSGRKANGAGVLTNYVPGRPKNSASTQTTMGETT